MFDLKGKKGQSEYYIPNEDSKIDIAAKQDRYLAILRGKYRKSSGSLQPLYTLLHFYRVWGCRVQVRSHSFHLVTEKTPAFRFPVFPNS